MVIFQTEDILKAVCIPGGARKRLSFQSFYLHLNSSTTYSGKLFAKFPAGKKDFHALIHY